MLKELYDGLIKYNLSDSDLVKLREYKHDVDDIYNGFVLLSQNVISTIDSITKYSEFIDDFNFLEHLFEVKNLLRLWIIEQPDDHKIHYKSKFIKSLNELKNKFDSLKSKSQLLLEDDIFIKYMGKNLTNLETNIGELEKMSTYDENFGSIIANKSAILSEIDFMSRWIDVVADNISSTNPKIVSYTWQLGDNIAVSELKLIQSHIENIHKNIENNYIEDHREELYEKCSFIQKKCQSTMNIALNINTSEYYDMFSRIKIADMQLEIFECIFIDPEHYFHLRPQHAKKYFEIITKVFDKINQDIVDISKHFSHSDTLTSPFFLILNDAQESLLINHTRATKLFKRLSDKIHNDDEKHYLESNFSNLKVRARIISEMINSLFIDDLVDAPLEVLNAELMDTHHLEVSISKIMDEWKLMRNNLLDHAKRYNCPESIDITHDVLHTLEKSSEKLLKYQNQISRAIEDSKSHQTLILIDLWLKFYANSKILNDNNLEKYQNFHKSFLTLLKKINEKKAEFLSIPASSLNNFFDIYKSCELRFEKLYNKIDMIYKHIGPSFHLEDLDVRLEKLDQWSQELESKINSEEVPLQLKCFEAELFGTSCDTLKKELKIYDDKISDNIIFTQKLDDIDKKIKNINHKTYIIKDLIIKEKIEAKSVEVESQIKKISLDLNEILEIKTAFIDVYNTREKDVKKQYVEFIQKYTNLSDIKQQISNVREEVEAIEKLDQTQTNSRSKELITNLNNFNKVVDDNIDDIDRALIMYKNDIKAKEMMKDYDRSLVEISNIQENFQHGNSEIMMDTIQIEYQTKKLNKIKAELDEFISKHTVSHICSSINDKYTSEFPEIVNSAKLIEESILTERNINEALIEVKQIETFLSENENIFEIKKDSKTDSKHNISDSKTQQYIIDEFKIQVERIEEKCERVREIESFNSNSQHNIKIKQIKTKIKEKCASLKSKLGEMSHKISIHEIECENDSKMCESMSILAYVLEVCNYIQKFLDNFYQYEFLIKNLTKIVSIHQMIEINIKEAISKISKYENHNFFDSENECYQQTLAKVKEFQEISRGIAKQIDLLHQINNKIDDTAMYIQWLTEKKSQITSCKYVIDRNNPKPETIAVISAIETFSYTKDDILNLLDWFENLKLKNEYKKLEKNYYKQYSQLRKLFQDFHAIISNIEVNSSAGELIEKLDTMHNTLMNLSNGISFHEISCQDAKKTYDPQSIYGSIEDPTQSVMTQLNYFRLMKEICENKIKIGKDELQSFISQISDISLTTENNNRKLTCLKKFESVISKLNQDLALLNKKEHRLEYVLECKIWYSSIKCLDQQISEHYAKLLNSFSSVKSFKKPLSSFYMLKLDFYSIVDYYKDLIGRISKISNEKLANHHSYCNEKEFFFFNKVKDAQKSLESIADNYFNDLNGFIHKVENSKYSQQNLNKNEMDFINLSLNFTFIVSFIELSMKKDFSNSSTCSYAILKENEKVLELYVEKASKLLEDIVSLSLVVDSSDWILTTPIELSSLEKQYHDILAQFKDYQVNISSFKTMGENIALKSSVYCKNALDLRVSCDDIYNKISNYLTTEISTENDKLNRELSEYQKKLNEMEPAIDLILIQWKDLRDLNEKFFDKFKISVFDSEIIPSLEYELIFDRYIGLKNIIYTIKDQNKINDTYSLLDPNMVRELTMVFLHTDKKNLGYLDLDGVVICLKNIGLYDEFINIFGNEDKLLFEMKQSLLNTNNDPNGRVYFKKFLDFVGETYSPVFHTKFEIIDAFKQISNNKPYITTDDLKKSLDSKAANFWIDLFSQADPSANTKFDYQHFFSLN